MWRRAAAGASKKRRLIHFWVRFNLGCQSSTSFPETSDPAHRRGPSDCAPYLVFFCVWKKLLLEEEEEEVEEQGRG